VRGQGGASGVGGSARAGSRVSARGGSVWLARLLGWLAGLGGEPMDPSPRVMNNEKASGPWLDL
jgi:hypothetical protein